MENLRAVLAYYGLAVQDGVVIEGDAAHHIQGYAHYLPAGRGGA